MASALLSSLRNPLARSHTLLRPTPAHLPFAPFRLRPLSNAPPVASHRPFSSSILRLARFKSCSPLASTPFNARTFFSSSHRSLTYRPPPPLKASRPFFASLDRIPANVVLYGIIAANILVFGMWYMAGQKYRLGRDSTSLVWMYENFTSSWRNIVAGRFWTIVTSNFSHKDWNHIFFNLFTFYFIAGPVLDILRSRQFIFLYLAGGLVCSTASLMYARSVEHRDRSSLGASGAIYAIVSFLACSAPKMKFYLYAILPMPAWLLASGVFVYDAYSTISGNQGTTDTVGHISGMLAGVGYYLTRRYRVF